MTENDHTQRPAPAAPVSQGGVAHHAEDSGLTVGSADAGSSVAPETTEPEAAALPDLVPGTSIVASTAVTNEAKVLAAEAKGPRVHLDRFEGPLDLLLFLIKEDELDITDIPIARITDQYLASIGDLEDLDLESAGEYLVMATSLMRIKAKMLIPRDLDDEEEDEDDPRTELMRRLLEYREFKRVSEQLSERQDEWRGVFARAGSPIPELESEDDDFEDPGVSIIDLFRAFRNILSQAESEIPIHMETESYSVDEQMDFLRAQCDRSEKGVAFHSLFEDVRSRALMITTFLALLEILRQREIVVHQVERFGEIWLRRAAEDAVAHE